MNAGLEVIRQEEWIKVRGRRNIGMKGEREEGETKFSYLEHQSQTILIQVRCYSDSKKHWSFILEARTSILCKSCISELQNKSKCRIMKEYMGGRGMFFLDYRISS